MLLSSLIKLLISFCGINSLKKNSSFDHEIVLHINDGSDGTLDYAIKNNIKHTHSVNNIGLCSAMNKAYHLTTSNYILYAHDDMFFCDKWDLFLIEEIDKYDAFSKLFILE